MGRPPKKGLDYFFLQTDLASDGKIQNLIRKGEMDAWTVYSWTLINIYHENYYTTKTELINQISWMFRTLSEERIEECLEIMADCDLIDRELYTQGIITSKGIQRRYYEVQKVRKEEPEPDYWLLKPHADGVFKGKNPTEKSFQGEKPHGNGVFGSENPQSRAEQSKAEQSRVKKSIAEKSREKEIPEGSDDLSDDLQSSFSENLIWLLEASGVEVKKNTMQLISDSLKVYDKRTVQEAFETAIEKKRAGKVKSVVGYAKTVMDGWANGKGCPNWIKEHEEALAKEKSEHMKPGKLAGVLY